MKNEDPHTPLLASTNITPKKSSRKYTFNRRPGTTGGLDGHFYEIDLLILGKLRGDRDTEKYFLASNVDGLGAFDDLVMRYWENHDANKESITILLQAKHVINSKKVTIEAFKNPKNDKFYLGKYFRDYLSSREKFNDKSKDPVFKGNFQELDLNYIIYTNAILDEQFNENRIIPVRDTLFSTKSEVNKNRAFQFSLDENNSDVIEILEKLSCQERVKLLAETLVSCISGKLNHNNMMSSEFFAKYHVFLEKNVIDVGNEIKEDDKKNKYREGKINHNFLTIDSEDPFKNLLKEKILYEYVTKVIFNDKSNAKLDSANEREALVDKVARLLESSKQLDDDVIKELGGNAIVLDFKGKHLKFADEDKIKNANIKQFIKDLKRKVSNLIDCEFDIPYEYVKKALEEQTEKEPLKLHVRFGNISPSFKKLQHFNKQLIELFEKYKSSKIIKIDDSIVGHGKSLTDGDVKNIGQLIGNVIIFDENEKKLRLANEESVDGETLQFIENLKCAAQSRELDIFSYRFDIKIKNFPREKLIIADEDRANVDEFLGKLKVFTGQASTQELEAIIKDEMKDLYKLTEEEVEDNFRKIKNKTEEYWVEGKFYLEKNDNFFENMIRCKIEFEIDKPVDSFSGREKELEDLHDRIQQSIKKEKAKSRVCISGLGGMGKTQLARQYAYKYKNYYDGNVIWINAENHGTLTKSFLRLALTINLENIAKKDIKSIVDDVYDFFSKRKCIFIFDNAEKLKSQNDSDDGIRTFLPSSSSNTIMHYFLITSRNQIWGDIEVMSLSPLTNKDAIDFVKKELKIEGKSQKAAIRKLIGLTQRLPLALAQAIAYIKQSDEEVKNIYPEEQYEIEYYIEEYEKKTQELLDFVFPDHIDNNYTQTTFTTWNITIDKIKKLEHGDKALEILDIIAYFLSDNISNEIFSKKVKNKKKLRAIQLLKQYSMINVESGRSSVHRLVQSVTRVKVNLKKREKEVLKEALGLFPINYSQAELIKKDDMRLENVDQAMSVWKYARSYEELVKEYSALPILIVSELNFSLRLEEAYLFGSDALQSLEKILSDNHLSVLSMMNNIASGLLTQGKYDDSLKFYKKLQKKGIDCTNYIALIRTQQGKHADASKLFSQQTKFFDSLGIESGGILEHNEGMLLIERGEVDAGMEKLYKALELKIKAFGPGHSITLNTQASIATGFLHQGKYEDALKLYQKVYEKRKVIFGENHPDTLTILGNISRTLLSLDRYDEALKIAIDVAEKRDNVIPQHPRTFRAHIQVGIILKLMGKYEEGLKKCKTTYEIIKTRSEPNDPIILDLLGVWYDISIKIANDKAVEELGTILRRKTKTFGPNHDKLLEFQLLRAGDNGHDGIRKLLLKINANIEDTDINGWTLLHDAAYKNHAKALVNLLNEGANINARSQDNKKPLDYSTDDGVKTVLKSTEDLFYAVRTKQNEVKIRKLLENGAIVNAVFGNDKSTVMHFAAFNGDLALMNALLKKRPNINAMDEDNWTPLHYAVQESHVKMVKLLLDHKANPAIQNSNGMTPLHLVVKNFSKNPCIYLEIVTALI